MIFRIPLRDTEQFYRDIALKLKMIFPGFQAWIIFPYTDLVDKVKLKKIQSYKVLNGSVIIIIVIVQIRRL